MRVLLDVNILVRANEKAEGPARDLLLALISRGDTLVLSPEILAELARVLRYPRVQQLYGLSEQQIYGYVMFLRDVGDVTSPAHSLNVPIRDPKDVHVLQTALAGEADVICTLDRDFYDPIVTAFCSAAGIVIHTDLELLKRLHPREA